MTDTITAIKKALEGVTQDEVIGFINTAMRNWSHVPKLDADDLRDLAEELQRFAERRYASTLESLQRENEELRQGKDHITAEKAGIAKNAHSNVDYWKSQYEASEAKLKRFTYLLEKVAPPEFSKSWLPPQDYEMIRTALSSTGDTHGN